MAKSLLGSLLLGACLVGGSTWAFRQAPPPPANDNFSAATILVGNAITVTGDNPSATKEAGEPLHHGSSGTHSVWWTWTAPADGSVIVDTNGSTFDTVLAVYTGSSVSTLTELTPLGSDDDGGTGTASQVPFIAVGGTTYRIAVDGFGSSTGFIMLHLNNYVFMFEEGFDPPAVGWTFDAAVNGSAWNVDATPASFPSGVSRSGQSLNFNNSVDYAGGSSGGAMSPAVWLLGMQNPVLEFWCNYDTETRGPQLDRRSLEVWNSTFTVKHADWQLASVGYSFNAAGGLTGIGPGPCAEAYEDLETTANVPAWHLHRVYLDPGWGNVHFRFVFWSVDDQRNNYAGWAIDDLVVRPHATAAPTGWPDNSPDAAPANGIELEDCTRTGPNLTWSWGCTNQGDAGVHMIIGNHPDAVLHESFMFFDINPGHDHYHLTQYSDFALWRMQAFGFQKVRRGPKRSFCLTDVHSVVGGATSMSPGCKGAFQAISYGWQDVYGNPTSGQSIDLSGLATGTDYYLVGVIDPLNRLRETNNLNQTDSIHFTLPVSNGQVALLGPGIHSNPHAPTASALSITAMTSGTFQGVPALQVLGTGFDITLVPVVYDTDTTVAEAPIYTIVSPTEIWVELPTAAGFGVPASIDLLRPSGDAASFRLGNPAATPIPPPASPSPPPSGSGGGGGGGGCGATGLEAAALAGMLALLRRSRR